MDMLDRTHVSLMKAVKIETGEQRSIWHKYVNIAVLNYNRSYHTRIGCEPSRVFHGSVAYNVIDLKKIIRPQKPPICDYDISHDVPEQTELIFHKMCAKNAIQAYIKYEAHYDKKANVSEPK